MATWPVQTDSVNGGLGVAGSAQAAANTFIPKLWSDELLVQREVNLVAANFFKRINFRGKKGDTLVIPLISDVTANDKTATNPVTIQTIAEGSVSLIIDTHKEVSHLFEDILMMQSRYDLRAEYNKKDGYALAKALDTAIYTVILAGLSATYKVIGSDGITQWNAAGAGNAADITDIGLRRAIQTLDDNLAPDDGRCLIIPPSQKNALLGIDKFTLFQNIGRTSELQKGMFGEIYGIPVKVSTNCPTVLSGDGVTVNRVAFLAHKDCVAVAVQQDVRVQAQYKQEYLATLVTSDMVYGIKGLRLSDDDTTATGHRKSQAVAIYCK